MNIFISKFVHTYTAKFEDFPAINIDKFDKSTTVEKHLGWCFVAKKGITHKPIKQQCFI